MRTSINIFLKIITKAGFLGESFWSTINFDHYDVISVLKIPIKFNCVLQQ